MACSLTCFMCLNLDAFKSIISQRANLTRWKYCIFALFCLDIDALVGGEVGGLEFGKLPFGACEDPIRWKFQYIIWIMGLYFLNYVNSDFTVLYNTAAS